MPYLKKEHTSIFYQVHGTGIPILFIHPPLLTKANFYYQEQFISSHYQVITFDIRGHGDSEPSLQSITYDLIIGDIIELLNHLKIEKAILCGYSTGGSIALEAMAVYPERFLGGILISAMSEVSDWWLKTRIHLAVNFSQHHYKKMLATSIAYGNANNQPTFTYLYKDAMKGDIDNWGQYYQYSLIYNGTDKLNQIQSPMLLMYGKKDDQFLRYAAILNKHLPNKELYLIKNSKHQIPTKAVQPMNDLIHHWISQQMTKHAFSL